MKIFDQWAKVKYRQGGSLTSSSVTELRKTSTKTISELIENNAFYN